MATASMNYGSWTAITITLGALPTSATLLVGRESTVVDNTSNLFLDVLCGGKIETGTSPTDLKSILIFVYGDVTGTTTYPDVLDGTDSAETFTDEESRNSAMKLAAVIATDATSDQTYWVHPFSIASLFGGVMPQKWGLFITHDTAVNLNSTDGNHVFSYIGTKIDSA